MRPVDDQDDIENHLAGLSLMLDLPSGARHGVLGILRDLGTRASIPAGETLFTEGDTAGDTGYVLLSGSVHVHKSYSPDSTAIAPAILGEVKQFLPDSARTATVRAVEELDVLEFDWNRFNTELERKLDTHDLDVVRQALLGYAWTHLLK